MAQQLEVTIVTPHKLVAKGEVEQVVAPAVLGQVGILPNHRPLLAELKAGVVELWRDGKAERLVVAGGYIEVERNHVTLIVESAERAEDIDVERAQKALAEAEAQLKQASPLDPEYGETKARAERAQARLTVAAAQMN